MIEWNFLKAFEDIYVLTVQTQLCDLKVASLRNIDLLSNLFGKIKQN